MDETLAIALGLYDYSAGLTDAISSVFEEITVEIVSAKSGGSIYHEPQEYYLTIRIKLKNGRVYEQSMVRPTLFSVTSIEKIVAKFIAMNILTNIKVSVRDIRKSISNKIVVKMRD